MLRSIIMLAACAALFSGCGGASDGTGPRGWKHYMDGLWTNPRSKHDEYTAVTARFDGTLQDLASQTTTKFVLGSKAKLVEYIRQGSEPVDPAVIDAMAANVCVLP